MNQRYHVFVTFVPETSVDNNTAEARERFANGIIALNNNCRVQTEYVYGNGIFHYGGDITPEDDTHVPHLSRFLTLRDTMVVMRMSFRDPITAREPTITDMLEQDSLLGQYYLPEHIPLVKQLYGFIAGEDHHVEHHGDDNIDDIDIPVFTI